MGDIRTFELHRDQDATGYSGTGVVADGCVFPDGATVVRWRVREGKRQSTELWDDVDHVVEVHGHDGLTRLEWC
jgi:hypothetical protein